LVGRKRIRLKSLEKPHRGSEENLETSAQFLYGETNELRRGDSFKKRKCVITQGDKQKKETQDKTLERKPQL